MKYYAELNKNNICVGVSVLKDTVEYPNMIKTDEYDETLLGKIYRGEATGFTELDYLTLENENNLIIIKAYNYLNEFQTEYEGEILIDIGGTTLTEQMTSGIITFEFENTTGEQVTIQTINENLRNGVLLIE
ncbi:hypothetical protein Amet_2434 [Alkaliphilus metalliredigens QYMF]|uniref:Uncharacterized protein n=1 Tax=Alkaliphilus metalliredigens (strain QYMF) TaxID=293826 RepID=A6TQX0_ALKMQ|nr:hypothetical protein [Alkaliphilus metalliredigens]ABR48588.1 hypothetical protein Amet_2434 [Alkaliphilus metalliredigens QYMF]